MVKPTKTKTKLVIELKDVLGTVPYASKNDLKKGSVEADLGNGLKLVQFIDKEGKTQIALSGKLPEATPVTPAQPVNAAPPALPATPAKSLEGYKDLSIRINTNEAFADVIAFCDIQTPTGGKFYNLRVRKSKFADDKDPSKPKYWVTTESRKGKDNVFRETVKLDTDTYRYVNGPLIEHVLAKKANPLQGQPMELAMEALKIHSALHSDAKSYTTEKGTVIPIETSKNQGIRLLHLPTGEVAMVQNMKKETAPGSGVLSKYAKLAAEGHKITWFKKGTQFIFHVEDGLIK